MRVISQCFPPARSSAWIHHNVCHSYPDARFRHVTARRDCGTSGARERRRASSALTSIGRRTRTGTGTKPRKEAFALVARGRPTVLAWVVVGACRAASAATGNIASSREWPRFDVQMQIGRCALFMNISTVGAFFFVALRFIFSPNAF